MKRLGYNVLSLLQLLLTWHIVALRFSKSTIPGPLDVLRDAYGSVALLLSASCSTAFDALTGLSLALCAAMVFGLTFRLSTVARLLLSPLLLASQMTPKIVVFPLLTICLTGHTAKVLVVAAFALFPMLDAMDLGLKELPKALVEQMRMFGATRLQVFAKLEVRHQLPFMLSALKVSFIFAYMGCMSVEFYKPSGLGRVINESFGDSMRYTLGWAGIVCSSLTGMIGWNTAAWINRAIIRRYYPYKSTLDE
jgi:ABC-type nitrate/sulfonate/bicarbonate transport system permease component